MISREQIYRSARIFFWLWSSAIVALSLIPGAGVGTIEINDHTVRIDYPLHAMAFFVLSLSAWFAWGCGSDMFRHKGFRVALAVMFTLAVVSEFLQALVPGRSFNTMDIVSNLAGIGSGLLAIILISAAKRPG